jgi:ABC-type amino acid transport substrate-binding protein
MHRRLVCALALWVVSASGFGAEPRSEPAAEKTFRVLVMPDARPEFFAAEPNPVHAGFEREILEGFVRARKMRLTVIRAENWDDLMSQLRDGRGDIIAGHFTDTEERRKTIDFTHGIMPTQTVLITRKPGPRIMTQEELLKRKIGAVKGGASLKAVVAAGAPKTNIDDTPTQDKMVELLQSGRVSALARALPLAILNQREDPELELGMFVGVRTHFAWGVRKDDTKLRDALNEHLAMVRRTGAWQRFVVKYFGEAAVDMIKQAEGH